MKKYLSVFAISFQQEFAYPLNFIMWRVRNVIQIFLLFFLWDSVFATPGRVVFGYDRAKILTYVFGILILKVFVFSARSVDVAGEISEGTLTNYLLKPLSYFKYWATRDLSSKALNLLFSVIEVSILFLLLRPDFLWQGQPLYLLGFTVSLLLAMLLLFVIRFIISFITFWLPEMAWGAQFLFIVIIVEFLSGSVFPLDILPTQIQKVLYLTPFPYLLFFPLQVYLAKVQAGEVGMGILVALVWVFLLSVAMKVIWKQGLKTYRAEGR